MYMLNTNLSDNRFVVFNIEDIPTVIFYLIFCFNDFIMFIAAYSNWQIVVLSSCIDFICQKLV